MVTSSPKLPEFYPPRLSPLVVKMCQYLAPMAGYWRYRMILEVCPSQIEQLKAIRHQRWLLLPNHPTYHDWIAIFLLSARLRETFYYLAAYERFQGLEGRFIERLGAYSIRRGLGDRPSVAKTLELLMQPESRLVIFPEGGCSLQNDTVMPFRTGALQIALQAMSKLVRQGNAVPDLYVIPTSLKYRYTGDMTPVIHNTLSRLEKALHVVPETTFYDRLRRVAECVLMNFEEAYGLRSADIDHLPWNARIASIKNHVVEACEQKLAIAPPAHAPLRERVYKIQHVLEQQAESLGADDFWTYESIHEAASRLLNFDAIYDGYVAAHPTPERFLDTLVRLERAVFQVGQPPPKGHRRVTLQLGNPVNLKDYFEQYQGDRTATVEALTHSLQQTVQQNLNRAIRGAGPSIRR